jgi:hypothetical protein
MALPSPTSRPRGYIQPPPRARLVEFNGTEFGEAEMTRAEQAVAKVLERYPTLLAGEVGRLRAAWAEAPEKLADGAVTPIFSSAHDLAGYGETFGYPLVTILARSLCRLLTMGDFDRDQMSGVVDAHITTLHVIIRDGIKGPGGAIGIALAAGLDKAIVKFHLALGTHGACRLSDEVAALQPKKPAV